MTNTVGNEMEAASVSPLVLQAADWLVTTTREEPFRPVVPALVARFGLTVVEAVAAIRVANTISSSSA